MKPIHRLVGEGETHKMITREHIIIFIRSRRISPTKTSVQEEKEGELSSLLVITSL
jgi:hypothetical protein